METHTKSPVRLRIWLGVLARSLALLAAGLSIAAAAQAQNSGSWFSVMGDPGYSDEDLVELNLDQITGRGALQVMELRVSLAKPRIMGSGEEYRSYFSHIELDCNAGTIVHRDQTRYAEPKWQGKSTFQKFVEVRPMAFGGLVPNPKSTILKAACITGTPGLHPQR